jgi:hypothetical protein
MMITTNFTIEEMCFTRFAALHGHVNQPDATHTANLFHLCLNVLQPLRDATGVPITVTSGFRSPSLNNAIEGAPKSQHMLGQAADIIVHGYGFTQLISIIRRLRLPVDQLIDEHGQWVHISHKQSGVNRGEILASRYLHNRVVTTAAANLYPKSGA